MSSIASIAKQAVAKHGDIDTAVEYVIAQVRRDPDLLAECLRPACQQAVWVARGSSTRAAKQGVSARNAAGLAAAASVVSDSILDSWCVGSKRLGDLSNYANPGKVWKRMGLAPFTGGKDGHTKAGSTWKMKGGLSAAEWTGYGYNPRRCSVAYCIAEALMKSNQDGDYRVLYLNRKAYELDRDPEMKPIQAHRRAMRYMVKRWLRELWKEWKSLHGLYGFETQKGDAVAVAA